MVALPEILAAAALLFVVAAELLHGRRLARAAGLVFGPDAKVSTPARLAPFARAIAAGAVAWGLATLHGIEPKVYRAKSVAADEIHHIVIVLDVSPSMKLADAGEGGDQMRRQRAFEVMGSFFKRVAAEQVRLSLIATYNGAKPVVVDTSDADVVHNFMDEMDMHPAFEVGKTKLLDGLALAAEIAEPWRRDSTTVVLVSDGDTVPGTGMPKMPKSVRGVLVIGVGDPVKGTFLDGKNSKQDASALRQIALRLGGTYHDGNTKHLPTETILALTETEHESPFAQLSRREYALLAVGAGASVLALLPWLLRAFASRHRPGIR